MSKINVGLIGLGRVGYGYDLYRNDITMTHYKAIVQNDQQFHLRWCVDGNAHLGKNLVESGYDGAFFETIPSKSDQLDQVDLIVVATPTGTHEVVIEQALSLRPKAILCEKPAGTSESSLTTIKRKAEQAGIPVWVNYMRRCEPGVQNIRGKLASGELGDVTKVVCWYSGGIKNNASHFIDLLQFWFGEVQTVSPFSRTVQENLPSMDDPDVDFTLTLQGNIKAYFIAGQEMSFGCKELECLSSKGVLRYLRGGFDIHFHPAKEHEYFKGVNGYGVDFIELDNDYLHFMTHVYDRIGQYFCQGAPFPSSLENALSVHNVINQVLRQESN